MAKRRGAGSGKKVPIARWYRLVSKSRETREDVLSSYSGRFHEGMEAEPTTYVADTIETAWREVAAHLGAVPANPAAFRLYRVSVRKLRLADLSDPKEQARHRTTAAELAADPPSPHCKEIARGLRQAGYHGLLYPSVRNPPVGRCAAFFLEQTEALITIEPADEEWAQFMKQGRT